MNKYISLSDRFNKLDNLNNNVGQNEAFIYLKSKRATNSEFYSNGNRSIDALGRTTNIFNLGKVKDRPTQYLKNQFSIINNNDKEKLSKKIFQNFFINEKKQTIRKIILSKKKILEAILDEDKRNANQIKNVNDINHNKKNKTVVVINNVSMPEIVYKKNIKKNKTGNEELHKINILNLKNIEKYNRNLLQEKLYQIQMNKIALFKKIKYAGLKKSCNKGFNGNNKKFNISEQNKNNEEKQSKDQNDLKNRDMVNNCSEITINSIREKVRKYFIGKFDSVKEYFYDWSEKGMGKLSSYDIYKYLNNKIKYRISKDEVKRIFMCYFKNNYLDLESFKNLFFEYPSNEKISIQLDKMMMARISSDKSLSLEKNKNDSNLSYYEKSKYNELINIIEEQKEIILLKLIFKNQKGNELNYSEFYNLIYNVIPENKKHNFGNQIKILFNNNKLKNIERINIKEFFDAISNKRKKNIKLNNINIIKNSLNNKNEVNNGCSTFYEKNLDNKNSIYNRNQNNIYIKKNNFFSKTNNLFYKSKEYNETKINKNNQLNELNELNEKIRECKSLDAQKDMNKTSHKLITFKINREKIFKEQLSKTHENIEKNKNINKKLYPRFRKFQLPIITKQSRKRNKNSDIIDIL